MIDTRPDTPARPTIALLNALPHAGFVRLLASIWEDSPWVAETVYEARPFADPVALHRAMVDVVTAAGPDAQLALLRAHPDLAGRLARGGGLTAHSTQEQAGLGLDRLSDAEFDWFDRHNAAYRDRFGFPFIIAVKAQTRDSIKAALETRLTNDVGTETRTALGEVAKIAKFRLEGLFGT